MMFRVIIGKIINSLCPVNLNILKKALLGEPMVAYILQKERIFIRQLDNFKFGIMNCLTLMVLVACYVTDSLST